MSNEKKQQGKATKNSGPQSGLQGQPAAGSEPGTSSVNQPGVQAGSGIGLHSESGKTKAVSAVVETVEDQKKIAGLVERSQSIIRATGLVAEKYYDLITFIRRNQVSPKMVSEQMGKLGFKRSRISEVNRVAQAKDAVYSTYEAKAIGFDKALQLARAAEGDRAGAAVVATPAARQLLSDGKISQDEFEASGDDIPAVPEKKKKVSLTNKWKAAARDLITSVAVNGKDKLPMVWELPFAHIPGGGVRLTIAACVVKHHEKAPKLDEKAKA